MGVRAGRGFLLRPTRPIKRGRVRFVASEMVLTGAPTAAVSVAASVPSVVLGSEYVVSGATAAVTVKTGDNPLTGDTFDLIEVVLAGGEVVVYGATAEVFAAAGQVPLRIISTPGTLFAGDPFAFPVSLFGVTGRAVANLSTSTIETDEPLVYIDNGATRSWWYRVMAEGPGTIELVISSGTTTTVAVEVFAGNEIDALDLLDAATWTVASLVDTPPLVVDLPAFVPHYIRLTSGGPSDTGSATLDYSLSSVGNDIVLEVLNSNITQTPNQVDVMVLNATPGGRVDFFLVGNPTALDYGFADESGTLEMSVDLDAINAGTYTLLAQMHTYVRWDWIPTNQGASGLDTFQVLFDPPERPSDLPLDDAPTLVAQGGTVRHWVLQDPMAAGLGSYVMPINPAAMSSPHPIRNYEVEVSVGPTGQPHIYESAQKAYPWTFSGFITNQAMLDEMQSYFELQRRFFIVDHHGRGWIVTWEKFDYTPLRPTKAKDYTYGHNYDASVLIYAGPLAVT